MSSVLVEIGLTRLLHYYVLRMWYEEVPTKTCRTFPDRDDKERTGQLSHHYVYRMHHHVSSRLELMLSCYRTDTHTDITLKSVTLGNRIDSFVLTLIRTPVDTEKEG
jgi:hypothetical protein